MRQSYRQKRTQWLNWLAEPVYWRNSVYDGGKRCLIVDSLCTEGLMPFLQQHGYTWAVSPHDLTNKLLNLMFLMYQNEAVVFQDRQTDWDPEHFTEYTHRIDTEAWDTFWEQWGGYADFDEDGFAHNLRYSIYLFAWNNLDLASSPVIIQRERENQETDENEYVVPKGKDDPYLQDTNVGIQDKHRHT